MLRKRRIAFSVACGIACVLLIVVCRSIPQPVVKPWRSPSPPTTAWYLGELRFGSNRAFLRVHDPYNPKLNLAMTLTIDILGFAWQRTNSTIHVAIPYWFLIVASAVLGYCLPSAVGAARIATTNMSLRFSLRTLLITTTLVAVVLGLAVALR
jgi:hypothetical protein